MKRILLILLSMFFILSCNKEVQENSHINTCFELSNSHINDINRVVELYNDSFLEVLNSEQTLKSESLSSQDKSDQIYTIFNNKLTDEFGTPTALKTTNAASDTIDSGLLQSYMDEMAERLLEVDENTALLPQDEIINLMSVKRDLFVNEIKSDEILLDWEKTIILENVLLTSGMTFVTLHYGEDLESIQAKGLKSWFKRNKKKIECTIKSATAVTVCASAVGGNWIAWVKCVSLTAAAANCWAQL